MILLLRLIKWFIRAWSAIIFSLILLAHFLLLHFFQSYATCINHTFTLFSQLVGAFLIAYSINSNFRILKQKSILALLTNYFTTVRRINVRPYCV